MNSLLCKILVTVGFGVLILAIVALAIVCGTNKENKLFPFIAAFLIAGLVLVSIGCVLDFFFLC